MSGEDHRWLLEIDQHVRIVETIGRDGDQTFALEQFVVFERWRAAERGDLPLVDHPLGHGVRDRQIGVAHRRDEVHVHVKKVDLIEVFAQELEHVVDQARGRTGNEHAAVIVENVLDFARELVGVGAGAHGRGA